TYISKGIATTKQPLRMEVISTNPLIIIDGAHNADKIASTVAALKQCNSVAMKQCNLHLINGFSGDKQLDEMIKHLASLSPTSVAITRNTINHFRKVASPADVQALWRKYSPNTKTEIFLNPKDAIAWNKKQMRKHDIL